MNIKISKREKKLILSASIFLCIFLMFGALISHFIESKKNISSRLLQKEKSIAKLLEIADEYHKYKSNFDDLEKMAKNRDKNFSLFAFLENASRKVEVKSNVKYMKPSEVRTMGSYKENMVEMEIDNITFDQLLKFMYEVEYGGVGVNLKRISMKRNQANEGFLDVILQIVTYEQLG